MSWARGKDTASHPLFFGWLAVLLSLPFVSDGANGRLHLANALAKEGQWESCYREACRESQAAPLDYQAALLAATAAARLNYPTARADLEQIINLEPAPAEVRLAARYERGCLLWRTHGVAAAYEEFRLVFLATSSPDLLLRSSRSLWLLRLREPRLAGADRALDVPLQALASLWTSKLTDECDAIAPCSTLSWATIPVQWSIVFYRSQISPALGNRCNLIPSCSAYALQALCQHGLLGIPMTTDRLCREKDIVRKREGSLVIDKRTFFADPLCNHDGWLNPTRTGGGP